MPGCGASGGQAVCRDTTYPREGTETRKAELAHPLKLLEGVQRHEPEVFHDDLLDVVVHEDDVGTLRHVQEDGVSVPGCGAGLPVQEGADALT